MLRVDKFNDKFDGKSHDENFIIDALKEVFSETDDNPTNMKDLVSSQLYVGNLVRCGSYASSWHINDYESSVMWDAYSNSNGGVLIETTFKGLSDSIVDERIVYGSKVIYGRSEMPLNNIFYPLIYKREQFRDEREFRVFLTVDVTPYLPINNPAEKFEIQSIPVSKKIQVTASKLVTRAFLHPLTPDWVVESIQGVISQYGEQFIPIKSSLYE